jgi:signal transduction histidine kinase
MRLQEARFKDVPRIYWRGIVIYIATIIVPALVLLVLGIRSFQLQRRALASLQAEKLEQEMESSMRSAAETALARHAHPMAEYFFTINNGTVTSPALHAAPPLAAPPEFVEAERLEAANPDAALKAYQSLFAEHHHASLALSRIARVQSNLGRSADARATWRKLAAEHPDEFDLYHRPYGIVAAIYAGDTDGLYDKIAAGRWPLSADQAEFFLSQLDPKRTTPYLDQFQFARELSDQFHPTGAIHQGEVNSYSFAGHRVFFVDQGNGRVTGFSVNARWVDETLRPQLEKALDVTASNRWDMGVYGGALAAVLIILSAGVALLWRDVSRETRLNRLRSDFVSSVSHELKTPITLIHLYGETLLRGIDDRHREDFCRIIMRESVRLGRLVEGILRFSRVERGDKVYSFEEGDLTPVVARVVDDYREYVERSGFHLKRTFAECGPIVRFDPAALSQAIVNLLDNAVKYSGESREIAVRLAAHEGSVTVEVEDQGIGIAASEREKIFERFYRSGNGAGKGGSGIGLYLVRHIMEAHGGRAEVDSEPGRGSRFRLVFPVSSPQVIHE